MQILRLGISTCPNDTFIYEALVNGFFDSEFQWDVTFADVQTLNEMVLAGELDVAKVSCGVLPLIQNRYRLLPCGGAMGYGCGPLLLSSKNPPEFDPNCETTLPGKNTTASLLFHFWYAKTQNKNVTNVSYAFFNKVYDDLLTKKYAQGVVIHEKRFTWKRDGLGLLKDLGVFWEAETHSPIPLGCAVVKKTLGDDAVETVKNEIRKSLSLAWERPNLVSEFIRNQAQIPDDNVIEQHIRMFVTDFTRDMGEAGKRALRILAEHVSL